MKSYLLSLVAAMFFVPVISIAATGSHDFSNAFKACYSAANAGNESKSTCLSDELSLQSKAVADSHNSISQILTGAEKQQLSEDFVSWKKKILLDCSILAYSKTVPIERENTRKYCLIERTIGRLNSYDQIRQSKTLSQ